MIVLRPASAPCCPLEMQMRSRGGGGEGDSAGPRTPTTPAPPPHSPLLEPPLPCPPPPPPRTSHAMPTHEFAKKSPEARAESIRPAEAFPYTACPWDPSIGKSRTRRGPLSTQTTPCVRQTCNTVHGSRPKPKPNPPPQGASGQQLVGGGSWRPEPSPPPPPPRGMR